MASPNVAGVAALIRSYYPNLTAKQVKHILMESGTAISNDVVVGGDSKDVRPFATLSKSGKIVNAYNALIMAEKLSKTSKVLTKSKKKNNFTDMLLLKISLLKIKIFNKLILI